MTQTNLRPALYISGVVVVLLSILMVIPIMADLYHGFDEWREFSKSQVICAFLGLCLMLVNRQENIQLSQKDTLLAATLPWIVSSLFAALPFYFAANLNLTATESLFESVSGLTTTGSTVIIGLSEVSKGVILWRSVLSWVGGIGFLMLGLAIFPFLEIAGMQSFNNQSAGSGVVATAARKAIGTILAIYLVLTAACFASLKLNGMISFDAFCLSLSSVSTGGYTTSDRSLATMNSIGVQSTLMVIMLLSSLPFLALLRLSRGSVKSILNDPQIKTMFLLIALFTTLLAAENMIANGASLWSGLFSGLFLSISALSTTGFHTGEHAGWGPATYAVIFTAMFIGGCAGSSASGLKIFRVHILAKIIATQVRRLLQPYSVCEARYSGRPIDMALQLSITGFFCLFILTWVGFSFALTLAGVDLSTSFYSAAASMANMPLLIGSTIDMPGYAGTFSDSALGILTLAMLAGRLEIILLLAVLMPRFWSR